MEVAGSLIHVYYPIGDEGAEALAAALSSNGTLKRLNLSSNPISAGQQRVVQHVLKTREYKM